VAAASPRFDDVVIDAVLLTAQLLGRADHVQDFVRKGSSEGYTEIHLSSGQARPIIIKRCLSSTSNSTEWYINGALLATCASLHSSKVCWHHPYSLLLLRCQVDASGGSGEGGRLEHPGRQPVSGTLLA
jgi:hypothetical protein